MTARWTPVRKAAIVKQIRDGRLARETAKRIHQLSEDELAGWEADLDQFGVPGLRVTKMQLYKGRERL